MRCSRHLSKSCEHYRERMSECRNCDPSDAPYKVCFLKRVHRKDGKFEKGFGKEYAIY